MRNIRTTCPWWVSASTTLARGTPPSHSRLAVLVLDPHRLGFPVPVGRSLMTGPSRPRPHLGRLLLAAPSRWRRRSPRRSGRAESCLAGSPPAPPHGLPALPAVAT